MSKNGKAEKFIGNVEPLDIAIVEKFLELNGLRWKDAVALLARLVLKRSYWDSFRSGQGPPGFTELDEHFMEYLDEQVKAGRADPEVVQRYKHLSFIEKHKYQLRPVTRGMLNKIIEAIESERETEKDEEGDAKAPPT